MRNAAVRTCQEEYEMIDQNDFRDAMQHMAASVTAITTRDAAGIPAGLMATAVTSLSDTPPSLVICVNRTATAHDTLIEAGRIGVSLVPEGATEFASHFAKAKGTDRFTKGHWKDAASGVPLYVNAPVAFDCHIARAVDGYSHTILIAEIDEIHFASPRDDSCLLWHQRKFAKIEPAGT